MTYNFEIINIVIEKIINKVNFNIISRLLLYGISTANNQAQLDYFKILYFYSK